MRVVVWAAVMLALVSPRAARAELSVTITPARLEMQVPSGESAHARIDVLNRGDAPFAAHMEVWDWRIGADGARTTFPPGTLTDSVIPFFTVSPGRLVVAPKAHAYFNITVSAPAAASGIYAMLYVVTSPATPGATSFGVGARLGVQVYIDTGLAQPGVRARIVEVEPPTSASALRLAVEIQNQANVHVKAHGAVEVMGPFEEFVGHMVSETSEVLLLPGETQRLRFTWGGDLAPAPYEAIATIFYGAGKGESRAAIDALRFDVPTADDSGVPTVMPATVEDQGKQP